MMEKVQKPNNSKFRYPVYIMENNLTYETYFTSFITLTAGYFALVILCQYSVQYLFRNITISCFPTFLYPTKNLTSNKRSKIR